MSNLYVKFTPFNEYTICNLINKTVWFSTVYGFNDFNELLGYIGSLEPKNIEQPLRDRINSKLSCHKFKQTLICDSIHHTHFGEDLSWFDGYQQWLNKLDTIETIDDKKIPEHYFPLLLEQLACASVGIFCVSHIDVFNDDAAQLMFAHYAKNLTGLALVYDIPSAYEVEYKSGLPVSSGRSDRLGSWLSYQFDKNDMDDFLKKSQLWEYEKEHRLFGEPGKSIKKDNFELKAILYTPRFDIQMEALLHSINEKHYKGTIIIKKILPDVTTPIFHLDNKHVADELKQLIENT